MLSIRKHSVSDIRPESLSTAVAVITRRDCNFTSELEPTNLTWRWSCHCFEGNVNDRILYQEDLLGQFWLVCFQTCFYNWPCAAVWFFIFFPRDAAERVWKLESGVRERCGVGDRKTLDKVTVTIMWIVLNFLSFSVYLLTRFRVFPIASR